LHNISSLKNGKIAILIVAAGRGQRAGGGLPKQYRKLGGEMVLTKTLKCFTDYETIVVAIHPDDKNLFEQACAGLDANIISVTGGATRTASVKAGLEALRDYAPDIVLIHDGARPFLKPQTIDNVTQALEDTQAAVPTLPIVDAVKSLDGTPIDRDQIRRVQTPQGFHFGAILQAYDNIAADADFADDIEVARQAGMPIRFCAGDTKNIKLTFEDDFMATQNMISITGSGYDVHQICTGKTLFLCGVEIDAGFSLLGHSDADVGHEVLWVLRDCLSGEVLLARSLLSSTESDLAALIREVKRSLSVPIVGVVSDGQRSVRKAVAGALPRVAHQLCHFHYLREAARPIYEADHHAKKELKKRVRGIRPIERQVEGRTDQEARAIRGYCSAVRSAITDDGRPPLQASGLKLHDRLSGITASLNRVRKKGGCARSYRSSKTL